MSHDLLIAFFTAAFGAAGWLALATQRNTVAIVELNIHLKELIKKVELVPKLEKDIGALHSKFREKENSK